MPSHTRLLILVLCLIVPFSKIAAQRNASRRLRVRGWEVQVDSNGFDKPSSYLKTLSSDDSAVLYLGCSEHPHKNSDSSWVESPPYIQMALLGVNPGFFDFDGDYWVHLRARFLPDSAVRWTSWHSRAESGHGNYIDARWPVDHRDYTDLSKVVMEEGLVTQLRRADTLQVMLKLYGQDNRVVVFPMQNRDVLEKFISKCTLTPER